MKVFTSVNLNKGKNKVIDIPVEDVSDLVEEVVLPEKEDISEETEFQPLGEEVKPLSAFKKKDDLEAYGKGFGIDLNKTKTLKNMYADLEAHIAQ